MTNTHNKAKVIAISLGIGLSTFLALNDVNALSPNGKQENISIKTETTQQIEVKPENSKQIETKVEIAHANPQPINNQKENNDTFIYLKDIKMEKSHQEFLYNMCKEKGLDYLKVLALIKHESQFDSHAIGNGNNYGYMQINKVNHKNLAKILQTKNAPLDPYVNIKWGTYMLSELYKSWKNAGISNEVKDGEVFSKLDRYVLSSYNRGMTGFKKYGEATKYIKKVEQEYLYLKKLMNSNAI